jgi:hypothetical protein
MELIRKRQKAGLSLCEKQEAYALFNEAPPGAAECQACKDQNIQEFEILDIGLCRGHVIYYLETGKLTPPVKRMVPSFKKKTTHQ